MFCTIRIYCVSSRADYLWIMFVRYFEYSAWVSNSSTWYIYNSRVQSEDVVHNCRFREFWAPWQELYEFFSKVLRVLCSNFAWYAYCMRQSFQKGISYVAYMIKKAISQHLIKILSKTTKNTLFGYASYLII